MTPTPRRRTAQAAHYVTLRSVRVRRDACCDICGFTIGERASRTDVAAMERRLLRQCAAHVRAAHADVVRRGICGATYLEHGRRIGPCMQAKGHVARGNPWHLRPSWGPGHEPVAWMEGERVPRGKKGLDSKS